MTTDTITPRYIVMSVPGRDEADKAAYFAFDRVKRATVWDCGTDPARAGRVVRALNAGSDTARARNA